MDRSLGAIESRYAGAAVSKCREHGCGVDFAGLPKYVILKGEALAGQKSAVCDCIVFDARHRLTVSLIEIKSSSLDADKIKRQFEGGGRKALEIAGKLGCPEPRLAVALVAKNYSKWTQYGALLRTKVSIGRKKHPILLRTCGARLADMGGLAGSRGRRGPGGARWKAGKGRARK